jgi:hypothetical protein
MKGLLIALPLGVLAWGGLYALLSSVSLGVRALAELVGGIALFGVLVQIAATRVG